MLKRSILSFSLIIIAVLTFAQTEKYHRVKINLEGKNPLILLRAGLALDHGKMAIGRYFESDFSEEEISKINKLGFATEIKINDVENYYANEDRPSELANINEGARNNDCRKNLFNYPTPKNYFEGGMGGYFTYDEMLVILDWMKTSYPNIISKLDTIKGYKTHDGNVIHYIKVSDNPNVEESEPEVLYTALHHAREPNSLSQMIFYLWYLLENYSTNEEIKYLVDNTEMYFVPCLNPDGYKLNQKNKPTGGGLWRKNAWKDATGKVVGVDLNRNYGYKWAYDNDGSSNIQGDPTYRGPSAFSEPETSAIREFCVTHNFVLALNYHTFGNYLIHPWGYNDEPTEEDRLFKSLGRVMNFENNYKLGTGTETVNYTVNGDSDDYMYGDEIEKNKIYAITPEVGYAFWPAKKDIDFLNKTCIQMNLALPRLANSMIDHIVSPQKDVNKIIDTININFVKSSFKNEPVSVNIYLDRNFSADNGYESNLNLIQGENQVVKFVYNVNENNLEIGENNIKCFIEKKYNGYKTIDSFYITIFNGLKSIILKEDCASTDKWTTGTNWGITTTPGYFTSAPSSFTDSPNTAYPRNKKNILKLKSGLDLSTAVSPILSFKTRWNIEKGYDYAIVYAFIPGKDTIWLCGNYTKIGTLDQKAGYPIYDGEQEFVTEIMSLEEFEGKKDVQINIEMVSDNGLEMDGIYVDDIEVFSFVPDEVSTKNNNIENIRLYPNPANDYISFEGLRIGSSLTIYNVLGQQMIQQDVISNGEKIDISLLKEGHYTVKIIDGNYQAYSGNLIIVR